MDTARTIAGLITIDPDIQGGTPVFAGTRVDVQSLLEHLEAGVTIPDYVDDFPTVTEAQCHQLLVLLGKMFNKPNYPWVDALAA